MLKRKKGINLTLKDFLSLVYIGTILMPILDQIINTYLLVALVGILNVVFCIDVIGRLKGEMALSFVAVMIPVALSFFEGLMGGRIGIVFIYQILRTTLLILMGLYYTLIASRERLHRVFRIAAIMLLITAITSIVVLREDPLAARTMATIGDADSSYAVEMNMRNLGGFSIVYMSVGILPFLLYVLNRKNSHKGFWLLVIIVLSIYIGMASYTTAILIGFLAILFALFGVRAKRQRNVFISFLVLGLLIFFLRYEIADMLYKLADTTVDIVSNRLEFLADSIYGVGADSDAQIRVNYYEKAWNAFLKHPLMGGQLLGDVKISGHSYILDMLAKYGCVGILILVLEYRAIYKLFYRKYKNKKMYYFSFLSFVVCIVLALLNPSENFFLLFVFLPIGIKALAGEDN